MVSRHRLAPPADSWVYELTDRGRRLEPILLALGDWGLEFPRPPEPSTLSTTSVLIFLRAAARPNPTEPDAVYRVQLDERAWTVRTSAGQVLVLPGEPATPDAAIDTDPKTFNPCSTIRASWTPWSPMAGSVSRAIVPRCVDSSRP